MTSSGTGRHPRRRSVNCGLALLVLAAVMSAVLPASAGSLVHTLQFRPEELVSSSRGGFDVLSLPGCDVTRETGRPQLPLKPLTLGLPPGTRATGIEVVGSQSRELLTPYNPMPVQPPRIMPIPGLSLPEPPFAAPDRSIYEGDAPYPAVVATMLSEGSPGGLPTVGIAVHPVQYIPSRGKVRFFTSITVRVDYEETGEPFAAAVGNSIDRFARRLVSNDVARSGMRVLSPDAGTRLEAADYDYVIITSETLEPFFLPLAEWKTRTGVPAATVTTSWIYANYTGADAPERIRNFIADARTTWGTEWLLLGGDTAVVPARRAYAMTSEAGLVPYEDEIAADLYYADLDGNWNADGDGVYGETADDVELYPDLFVGRAPVTNGQEVDVFVDRTLAYEKATAGDYQLDMLMTADILWQDPYTDSGEALNRIDTESVPPRYDPIEKLYQSAGNESPATVTAALNSGSGHYLHSGHAWYNCMGAGTGYLANADADGLVNGDRRPLLYSIGCWPAAFDLSEDCIAERFLLNPDGGAAAFIGNDRYGWAAPGTPGFGYSERFMQAFYRLVFVGGVSRVGEALAAAKAEFVPLSQSENVYRWHQYQLNLLGDPEMKIWTDEPATLTVEHPASLGPLETSFPVSVWTSQGPVEGALVCVTNNADVYERGTTTPDGAVSFEIATSLPESLHVTVTGADCVPYESSVPVGVQGSYLGAGGLTVDDDGATNRDGKAGPGETVDVSVSLNNYGSDAASGVEATLSCVDEWLSVVSASSSFGEIAGGGTGVGIPPFRVEVVSGCPDGHVASLELTVTGSEGRSTWETAVPLTVSAPVIECSGYSLDDALGGDGDGVPEPDEDLRLLVSLQNAGSADAIEPSFLLWSSDPDIIVTDATADLEAIPSGSSDAAVFGLRVSPDCTPPVFPDLYLETTTADYVTTVDTLTISVGSLGFSHDFETGDDGWTHGGAGDLWARSDERSRSGAWSWYCGDALEGGYADNMDCSLVSPEFVLGVDTELSFWCWYDVTIYGVDGCLVELVSGGAPVDTLDFIGSGGALGALGSIGNDWIEYGYVLTGDVGDTVRVRFRFVSDATDTAEGIYIDDVSVTSGVASSDTEVPGDAEDRPAVVELSQNCPNPFTPSTAISYRLFESGEVTLSVYSIQGRLIRTLVKGTKGPGEHMVLWDGTDELGADVAAGVYLYRVVLGEHEETRKMILIR